MSLVVGLDLSLRSTGIAAVDRASGAPWVARCISDAKGDAVEDRWFRLYRLARNIESMIKAPDVAVIEAPAYDSRTGHQHDRSGLWWFVVDWLWRNGIPVVEVTTGGVKRYATGKGNAKKDHVLAAVVRRYPTVEVTGNDEADALVLAAMGARWLGHPIDDPMPKTHLAAMDGVHWPERVSA